MEERAPKPEPAFVDLSSWRKVQVSGSDALRWLDDLVSNRIEGIREGESRRALLLSRTGHIQADFHVTPFWYGDGLLLIQDPVQPKSVEALLAPYVLSSDVELRDRTADFALFNTRGIGRTLAKYRGRHSPSVTGAGFADDLMPAADAERRMARFREQVREATLDELDADRIRRGIARFGVDLGTDSLPQEAGLDAFIDATKGCFLGQEAVAKIRNLGHPAWMVLALHADGAVRAGTAVRAGDEEVGTVTSAAPTGGTALIARVRWPARDAELATSDGLALTRP